MRGEREKNEEKRQSSCNAAVNLMISGWCREGLRIRIRLFHKRRQTHKNNRSKVSISIRRTCRIFGRLFSANPIRSHLTHAKLETQMAIIIILMTAMCQSYFVLFHFELHSLHELRVLVYAWFRRTRRFLGRIFYQNTECEGEKAEDDEFWKFFLPIFSPLWLSSSLRVFTGHALSCE